MRDGKLHERWSERGWNAYVCEVAIVTLPNLYNQMDIFWVCIVLYIKTFCY